MLYGPIFHKKMHKFKYNPVVRIYFQACRLKLIFFLPLSSFSSLFFFLLFFSFFRCFRFPAVARFLSTSKTK
jgi:hypothetical protein